MTTLISPRAHDLGDGFVVRRAVPSLQARSIGPFVFVDHMGPVVFEPGRGMDVRPHPHIGLATVTYLWEGAIHHRDTLGSLQDINPGDVNWMTAGRGIAHSERTPDAERRHGYIAHGMQIHTLAEGIETPEQRQFLRDVGCELSQGFLYRRPESLSAILFKIANGMIQPSTETPEEREKDLIARGRAHVITDGLREIWKKEYEKYKDMVQEKVIL